MHIVSLGVSHLACPVLWQNHQAARQQLFMLRLWLPSRPSQPTLLPSRRRQQNWMSIQSFLCSIFSHISSRLSELVDSSILLHFDLSSRQSSTGTVVKMADGRQVVGKKVGAQSQGNCGKPCDGLILLICGVLACVLTNICAVMGMFGQISECAPAKHSEYSFIEVSPTWRLEPWSFQIFAGG